MIIVRYLLGLNGCDISKVGTQLEEGIKRANSYFTSNRIPKVKAIKFILPNRVEMEVDCNSEKDYDNHILRYAVNYMFKEQGVYRSDSANSIRSSDPNESSIVRKNLIVKDLVRLVNKNRSSDEQEALKKIEEILSQVK